MKPKYFRIDAVILKTFGDDDSVGREVEEILENYFNVIDLSVFRVIGSPDWNRE